MPELFFSFLSLSLSVFRNWDYIVSKKSDADGRPSGRMQRHAYDYTTLSVRLPKPSDHYKNICFFVTCLYSVHWIDIQPSLTFSSEFAKQLPCYRSFFD